MTRLDTEHRMKATPFTSILMSVNEHDGTGMKLLYHSHSTNGDSTLDEHVSLVPQ